jgi:hypothetical protein
MVKILKMLYNKIAMDKKPRNITEYSMKLKQEETIDTPDTPTVSDKIVEGNDEVIRLSRNDLKKLNQTKYFELKDKYKTAFILKNKKTGVVVEIQASSAVHACHFIGWRPKNVKIIDTVNI